MSQLDTGFAEDMSGFDIHVVALAVHHLGDADLDDLDAARQTRTGIAV